VVTEGAAGDFVEIQSVSSSLADRFIEEGLSFRKTIRIKSAVSEQKESKLGEEIKGKEEELRK
jgi:hypothetical protein